MKRALVALASLLLGIGCSHTVQYKLTDKDHWAGPKSEKTLCVPAFRDETLLSDKEIVHVGDAAWIVNFRGAYRGKEIANGVSAMIAQHLAASGLFRQVTSNCATATDYELTGTIAYYNSRGRLNQGAYTGTLIASFLGSIVGCGIALAATSGIDEPWDAQVELRDVSLKDRATGQLLWHDTIKISQEGSAFWLSAADTGNVCDRADDCLHEAVTELIHRIGTNSVMSLPPPAKP